MREMLLERRGTEGQPAPLRKQRFGLRAGGSALGEIVACPVLEHLLVGPVHYPVLAARHAARGTFACVRTALESQRTRGRPRWLR